jgi:hypothetical protein
MNKSSNSTFNNHVRSKKSNQKSKSKQKLPNDGVTFAVAGTGLPHSHIPKSIDNQVYNICQSYQAPANVTTSTSINTYGNANMNLSLFDQASSLAAVFDQYRIKTVESWICPRTIQSTTAPSAYASVIDYDDSNNLTTYQLALDYQNCVESTIYQGHYRRWEPHSAVAAFASGVFTSYGNVKGQWIDAASTGVPFYGLKIAALPTTVATPIDIIFKVHFQFRNIR